MAHDGLKAQLEEKLAILQDRIKGIRKDLTQEHSGDSAEQAQERENDQVIDVIGNETTLSFKLIRAALDRIEQGRYGLCERCGEEIGENRLLVVPEAEFCVNCAR